MPGEKSRINLSEKSQKFFGKSKFYSRNNYLSLTVLFSCFFSVLFIVHADNITDAKWTRLKKQAINRKRNVIYNNDGCDAVYFPYLERKNRKEILPEEYKATKENFIKQRLANTLGTKISTISYCPICSGFGYLTSRTQVGDQLSNPESGRHDLRNITKELLAQGTDPLKITEEFCRKNDFEFFISFRCNDTHDAAHSKKKPHILFPPFKANHPEYLMGAADNRPIYSPWSAVDYTHQAVRNRFVAICKEFIQEHDPDALELDFCRHLQYFKSVAWGGTASAWECEMMTECLRQIRKFAEEAGRRRGRPILIAVRLPDSVDYCKAVGLDLERWMREKLIDMYIGSFYLRLNHWEESVDLCRKYGVKFYAGLSESRIKKGALGFERNRPEVLFARAMAALRFGVDGVYYFNYEYKWLKSMYGTIKDLELKDKTYFITYRERNPGVYLWDGTKYQHRRLLCPDVPAIISPQQAENFTLEMGDDLSVPAVKAHNPEIAAYAMLDPKMAEHLSFKVNGNELRFAGGQNGVSKFATKTEFFKPGKNLVEFALQPGYAGTHSKKVLLKGDKLLRGRNQGDWRRLFKVHDFPHSEKIVDGAYRITDTGTKNNEFASLLYPLKSLQAGGSLRLSLDAKVEKSSDLLTTVIRVANGKQVEVITLQPDNIGLLFNRKMVKFNTADSFHHYDIAVNNGCLTLKVDGATLFDEQLTMSADNSTSFLKKPAYIINNMHRKSLLIGSLSGSGTGSALWKNISYADTGETVVVRDLRFELKFPLGGDLKAFGKTKVNWDSVFNANSIQNGNNDFKIYYPGSKYKIGGVEHKTIIFDNSRSYDAVRVAMPKLVNARNGILMVECRIKGMAEKPDDRGFFQLFAGLEVDKDHALYGDFALGADKLVAMKHQVFPAPGLNTWITFRLALSLDLHVAMFWINGKEAGAVKVPLVKSAGKTNIQFGDGSKTISGKYELDYIKFALLKTEK